MNTSRNRTSSARRTRRISTWIAASAVALGLVLLAAGEATAGDRTRFSIGFSVGSGHHYRGHHYNRHHGFGHRSYFRHHRSYRNYCSPFGYRSYRSHYYRPYRSGVSLNYNYIDYNDNTARLIVPPQSRVYSTTTPVTTTTTTTYTAPSTPQNNIVYQYNYEADGWSLLRNNRAREAVDIFAKQAEASPNAGLPKVGYALSQAAVENHDKAAWAMRKALQYDAASLDKVPQDPATQQVIDGLLSKYQQRAEGFSRADDPFMIAAMLYITRDYTHAQQTADALVKTNPDDPAIRTLSSMAEHQQSKATAPSQGQYQYPYQP